MLELDKINFNKLGGGLIPVCIQNYDTMEVLMIGFMNEEALSETIKTGKVTFFSRSKNRLWVKGETSNHWLEVIEIAQDCDEDSLLIYAKPHGPTCHTGAESCFKTEKLPPLYWFGCLHSIIAERKEHPKKGSYTTKLFQEGTLRTAQKVGEEGVEVALAAVVEDDSLFIGECVDLLYHLFVLIEERNITWDKVGQIVKERRGK